MHDSFLYDSGSPEGKAAAKLEQALDDINRGINPFDRKKLLTGEQPETLRQLIEVTHDESPREHYKGFQAKAEPYLAQGPSSDEAVKAWRDSVGLNGKSKPGKTTFASASANGSDRSRLYSAARSTAGTIDEWPSRYENGSPATQAFANAWYDFHYTNRVNIPASNRAQETATGTPNAESTAKNAIGSVARYGRVGQFFTELQGRTGAYFDALEASHNLTVPPETRERFTQLLDAAIASPQVKLSTAGGHGHGAGR